MSRGITLGPQEPQPQAGYKRNDPVPVRSGSLASDQVNISIDPWQLIKVGEPYSIEVPPGSGIHYTLQGDNDIKFIP